MSPARRLPDGVRRAHPGQRARDRRAGRPGWHFLQHLPAAAQCTTAKGGRTITIGPHEARLTTPRQAQASPAWKAHHKATPPMEERKIVT